ncbi:hypothetical protein, partial [Corynebacterium durum]|uniref:hypothetical protein n=1 Tax=Corynebacterium durum TaxID=61592 RepID=UPI00360741EE
RCVSSSGARSGGAVVVSAVKGALVLGVLADVTAVLVGSVASLPQAVKPHAIVAAATTDNAVVVTVGVVRFMV